MFLKDFQEVVEGTKSPKSVQSPEIIRQSHRIPELFQVIETSSSFFCPGQGKASKRLDTSLKLFLVMFPKMQHAMALVRKISAMSKCQLMKWCFLSTPPVPVEILTPHLQAAHTGKASRWCPQGNNALKIVSQCLEETSCMWGSEAASQMEDNLILNVS